MLPKSTFWFDHFLFEGISIQLKVAQIDFPEVEIVQCCDRNRAMGWNFKWFQTKFLFQTTRVIQKGNIKTRGFCYRAAKKHPSISIWIIKLEFQRKNISPESLYPWLTAFLAVQDSSITDIVCRSVCLSVWGLSQLTIREPREHQRVTLDTSRH